MLNNIPQILKQKYISNTVSHGRWTKPQCQRFMKALQRYGRDWVEVQKLVKTRTLTQVRSHAQKVFVQMKEQDIQALISGDGYSDSQDNFSRIQNVKSTKNKQKNIIKDSQDCEYDSNKGKGNKKQLGQSLLDIFQRAIEHQTLELQNQKIKYDQLLQAQNISNETKQHEHETQEGQKNIKQFLQRNQNIVASQKHEEISKIQNNQTQILPQNKKTSSLLIS